jgi:hypothetical protein
MKMHARAVLTLIAAPVLMGLTACGGHSSCGGATFGNSSGNSPCPAPGGSGSTTAAFVFVLNGSASPGEITSYTLDTVNTLLQPTSSNGGPNTPGFDAGIGMAVAQKQFLYAAFGSTSQIFGWSISSVGTLTPIATSPVTATFASATSTTFDTNRLATNPAGTILFIADAAQDQIFVYQIGSGGVLTAVAGSPFTVPFSPGNLATDGLGNYLYITATSSNHTGSEIGAYSIGTGSNLGVLTAVTGSPFAFPMWQVQGEPTGKFLIGTTGHNLSINGSDDYNLYVFSIAQSGANAGAITEGSPFLTTTPPYGLAVQSNSGGNLVYSLSLVDSGKSFNAAEGFTLNSDGSLSAVGGSPFANAEAGDTGQFDQNGTLFFEYGGALDAGTMVYSLGGFEVVNSEPAAPAGSGTYGGFWVATDSQ